MRVGLDIQEVSLRTYKVQKEVKREREREIVHCTSFFLSRRKKLCAAKLEGQLGRERDEIISPITFPSVLKFPPK